MGVAAGGDGRHGRAGAAVSLKREFGVIGGVSFIVGSVIGTRGSEIGTISLSIEVSVSVPPFLFTFAVRSYQSFQIVGFNYVLCR